MSNDDVLDVQVLQQHVADLQQQVADLEEQISESEPEMTRLKDMAARAQADLQNAKSRMERESADMRAYAIGELMMKILPTVDNLQRAFVHLPEDIQEHEWVKGVTSMEKQLMSDLASVGLKRIEAIDQPVNPDLHDVLQLAPGAADTVVQVLEDGYMLNDRVIRPAKVVAGNGEKGS